MPPLKGEPFFNLPHCVLDRGIHVLEVPLGHRFCCGLNKRKKTFSAFVRGDDYEWKSWLVRLRIGILEPRNVLEDLEQRIPPTVRKTTQIKDQAVRMECVDTVK